MLPPIAPVITANKVSKVFPKSPPTLMLLRTTYSKRPRTQAWHTTTDFSVLFAIWQNRYNWQPRAGVFVVCFHIPLVTAASVWKLRGTCHSLQYHKNPTCYLKTCSEHTSLIKSSKTKPKRKKEEPDLGSLEQNSLFFKVHLLCSSKEKQSGD